MRIVAGVLVLGLAGCVAAPPPAAPPPVTQPVPLPEPVGDFVLSGAARQGGVMLGMAPARTVALTLDGMAVPVAGDGCFLIAFDRDAPATARLVATLRDGRQVTRDLAVAAGDWRIERLDTLAKTPLPDAEFARRRPAELDAIRAARAIDGGAQGWRQPFAWPATGRISGLFGAQRVYRGEPGAYHSGVDVAKPTGAVVTAPADGVVILAAAAPFTLEGNLLMIDHGMGLNSAFLHLSRIDVRVGDHVRQGDPIGLVGATGRATGPHLHWGMMWRGRRIDPAGVAGAMRGE